MVSVMRTEMADPAGIVKEAARAVTAARNSAGIIIPICFRSLMIFLSLFAVYAVHSISKKTWVQRFSAHFELKKVVPKKIHPCGAWRHPGSESDGITPSYKYGSRRIAGRGGVSAAQALLLLGFFFFLV